MNESDNLEGLQGEEKRENTYGNPYTSESSADIYATPDVTAAPEIIETEVVDTHGLFSGSQQETNDQENYSANPANPGNNIYPPADNGYGGYGGQSYYGSQPGSYGVQPPYGNQQDTGYGVQPPYGGQQGGYGVQPPYDNQQSAGYGGQPYYESQQGMGYGGQPPYGNQPGYGGQPPYGNQPPYNNPYSPYAMPQKGQHTGLIIGIVVVIIILFLVAVFALASRAADMFSEKEKEDLRRDVYSFDDAFDFDDDADADDEQNDYFYNDHDYGYDYDYDYDYDYGYDYDYDYDNEKYYTIHNDIRDDLSYQVDMEYYEYEADDVSDNVMLIADYPVISGDDVPNLDKLNKAIRKELDLVTDLFEKDYKKHIQEDEDAYFVATLTGYVTYMDEDKLSVIYQEELYNDMGGGGYLICVNVDMKNGVVLDNKEILKIDDAFSVDFRERSDEQNGEIDYLNYMTDQEITKYFNSNDVIVFYTPKGMEIGFNYDDGYGWVTVTYEEYEEYLKVF